MAFFHRVFSECLNPEKNWYAVNSKLIDGKEVCKLSASIFCKELFPEEFRKLDRRGLRDWRGKEAPKSWFPKTSSCGCEVLVATPGAILCYLIRILNQKSSTHAKVLCTEVLRLLGKLDLENYALQQRGSLDLASNAPTTSGTVDGKAKDVTNESRCLGESRGITVSNYVRQLEREIQKLRCQASSNTGLSPFVPKATSTPHQPKSKCGKRKRLGLENCSPISQKIPRMESLVEDQMGTTSVVNFQKPDWVYLYFKLKSKIPNDGWQDMLNLTYLGRTGVRNPTCIFLRAPVRAGKPF